MRVAPALVVERLGEDDGVGRLDRVDLGDHALADGLPALAAVADDDEEVVGRAGLHGRGLEHVHGELAGGGRLRGDLLLLHPRVQERRLRLLGDGEPELCGAQAALAPVLRGLDRAGGGPGGAVRGVGGEFRGAGGAVRGVGAVEDAEDRDDGAGNRDEHRGGDRPREDAGNAERAVAGARERRGERQRGGLGSRGRGAGTGLRGHGGFEPRSRERGLRGPREQSLDAGGLGARRGTRRARREVRVNGRGLRAVEQAVQVVEQQGLAVLAVHLTKKDER